MSEGAVEQAEAEIAEEERKADMVSYLRELATTILEDEDHTYALHVNVTARVVEGKPGGPWKSYVETGVRDVSVKVDFDEPDPEVEG